MPDNKTLNDSNITGRKCNTELDLKENIGMYNLESEKHCPKCGGKMMDLVLTSYPAQHARKCMSCGYVEDKHRAEGKCKETFPRSSACIKCPNNRNNGLVKIEFT